MQRARRGDGIERAAASGLVSLFGVGFLAVTLRHLLCAPGATAKTALAGVGALLAATLIGAGGWLYRSGFDARHLARIAGWAALGTALLGAVLVLIDGAGTPIRPADAAALLAVSTIAHVLIGVRDVQRIRAEALARQREKLAVLNRLVRHNLRHEAQRLAGLKTRLEGRSASGSLDSDEQSAAAGLDEEVQSIADRLTGMHEQLGRSQRLVREAGEDAEPVDLGTVLESLVADVRSDHPDLAVDADLASGATVLAGNEVEAALRELLENATTHAESRVAVSLSRTGSRIVVDVADDGPGIPEAERKVILREADIDQLSHSQGLGLWFVRWVMDHHDGSIDIDADDGTSVRLTFPAA
ncbi:MAG: sensor histidine kinase [Halanaeroarchaeum sp.]